MIYIEFIERDRSMPVEIFRQLGRQSSDWTQGSSDRLILQIGRTLRLGPMPSYLALWQIPHIDRLDEWEAYFGSPDALANRRSQAMHRAIHIQRAGLYDSLFSGGSGPYPLYYLEYYRSLAIDRPDEFPARLHQHGLLHVLRRVGWLGPEPEAIAVWGCESYRAVETVSRQARLDLPLPMDAGVYKELGEETL